MDKDKQKAGMIGGARRAEILPASRRAEIARQAAERRWKEVKELKEAGTAHRVLESFRSVLDLAGMQLPCAIVQGPDGIKRVLVRERNYKRNPRNTQWSLETLEESGIGGWGPRAAFYRSQTTKTLH